LHPTSLLTQPPVAVDVGDKITTTIAFANSTGHITATIGAAGKKQSSVVLTRPFPNEPPPAAGVSGSGVSWHDWGEFLRAGEALSTAVSGLPGFESDPDFNDEVREDDMLAAMLEHFLCCRCCQRCH